MTPEQYDELYERVYAPIYEWDLEEQEYHERMTMLANQRATDKALRVLSRAVAMDTRRRECRRR